MMTTKEVRKEANETVKAIITEFDQFTIEQWNYYLSEIIRGLTLELTTNLWEKSCEEDISNEDEDPWDYVENEWFEDL